MTLIVSDTDIIEYEEPRQCVYVPENFDAQVVLGCDQKWADSANWLLDRIYIYSHFGMRADVHGFTPLKVEYLRQVIPQAIEKNVREQLQEAGVIECDGHYIEGKKSFGYRLTPEYQRKHRRIEIRHPLILEKIDRVRRGHLDKLSEVHRHLHKQFSRVTLDLKAVEVTDPERKSWEHYSVLTAEEMRNNAWTPVVCEFGRFHTPLTRIMSEYRKGVRLDGKRVINLDIANSQPLFLSVLFLRVLSKNSSENQFLKEDHEFQDILTTLNISPEEIQPPPATPGAPYTMVNLINPDNLKEDVRTYIHLTETGKLYDFLIQNSPLTRKQFKERLFKDVFFGQNYIKSKLTQEFERLFPNVMEFIKRVKRGNYARLAWIMQREESKLMIDGVCGRFMKEYPGMPFLTIHDSIMTLPEYEGMVRSVITEEFAKCGLKPTIRTEFY